MPDTKNVMKVLRDELTLQKRHCKLLEAQKQALLACDRDRFIALHTEYKKMLPALEARDGACRAALTDEQGNSLTLSAIQSAAPAGSRAALAALKDDLHETITQVQNLARRNQTLIQNELDYFAFTLDLFVEAGRSADHGYGPNRHAGQGRLTGRLFLDRRA